MINKFTVALIIPCYNEEDGLKVLLPKIPNFIDEIIIVDNNCTDDTPKIAKEFGCTVMKEEVSGYGAAYKRGFSHVDRDIIITMDGDDTYPIEEAEENIKLLLDNNLDFISCARFPLKDKTSMNISNQIGNKILTIVTKVMFGEPLKDSQSGMWIFRRSILDLIQLSSDGMPLSQEIKIMAIKHPKINFYESHIGYTNRIGEVKLNKWRDGFKNLTHLFKIKFSKQL